MNKSIPPSTTKFFIVSQLTNGFGNMFQVVTRSNHKTTAHIFALFAGKFFLYLIGITLLICGLTFLLSGDLAGNPFAFLLSLAIAAGITTWEFTRYHGKTVASVSRMLLASLFIFFAATFLTGKLYDKSWDGMAYHQITIMELSRGWNPFYEPLPDQPVQSHYLKKEVNLYLYVNHYGKGLEIFSAALLSLTGNIESGKVFHIVLLLSAFCFTLHTLLQLNITSTLPSVFLAMVAAFNPITVNQLFSYYIDSAIASLYLIVISQLTLLIHNELKKETQLPVWLCLFFAIVVIANIKFTGVIYLAWISLVYMGLLLYLRLTELLQRFLILAASAGIAATCVAGVNPYLTNTISNSHPFYPIAGKNKVDVIINMMPAPLEGANRIERFLMSTFSSTDNSAKTADQRIHYKIPFTFTPTELKTLMSEGVRLGGFGVLWSGIFCVTLPLFFWTLFRLQTRMRILLIALAFAILGSVAINPVAWWARFVPQLWLFPVVVIVFFLSSVSNHTLTLMAKVFLVVMIFNTILVALPYTYSVYTSTSAANKIFQNLKGSGQTVHAYFDMFTPNALKFENQNIPYKKATRLTDLPCNNVEETMKIQFCREE